MPQVVIKPVSWFRPDPNQPRKFFDESELLRLGESLKLRQNDPLQAFADGLILDGERRWRAAGKVGLENLDVIITDVLLPASQINVIRLTSFFHKADLTGYEKWHACSELMSSNPQWQMKDLADALKVDASSATRYLSPSKCIVPWQDALKERKVGISDCYAASKFPMHEQSELLAKKLSGASRDMLECEGRKARGKSSNEARAARIPVKLPGGVNVVISGIEMTIDQAIESLSEVLKSARKARDEGLTAKSWVAAMKDKSRKAG